MQQSKSLFKKALEIIPGGVNSPVRAFGSVGSSPIFMKRGDGAYLFDEDDNRYIDYVGSWGPMILGHNHPQVIARVKESIDMGLSFGTATKGEIDLAQKVQEYMPHIEMLRMVSSGTEACMSALRLARGYTGRDKILKFVGCYHGHADCLLVKAGSGLATLGIPGSPGVPEGATRDTLTVPFNDLEAVSKVLSEYGNDLAAIIVEPIVGNAGFIRPAEGFLEGLRRACTETGTLLILDEVMTGFRVARGGAQELYPEAHADIVTLGKVIGGGMPIGAYGGRRDIMAKVAPSGPVYQAGTLSGNPVSVACGLATLEILGQLDFSALGARSHRLMSGLLKAARSCDLPFSVDHQGGMFGFRFLDDKVKNFEDAEQASQELFNQFFNGMLAKGVYLAPSAFEAGFVSFAHSDEDIDSTIEAAASVFKSLEK